MKKVNNNDLKEIEDWYHSRNIPICMDILPKDGLIIPGVAAIFCYYSDDLRFALIEGIVTNPKAGLKTRDKAVSDLIVAQTALAVEKGVRYIFGVSDKKGIIKKAKNFGYKATKEYMFLIQEF